MLIGRLIVLLAFEEAQAANGISDAKSKGQQSEIPSDGNDKVMVSLADHPAELKSALRLGS